MELMVYDIARLLKFVGPLIWAGCCIMAIIKFRGRLSATLAAIGFGIASITSILFAFAWFGWGGFGGLFFVFLEMFQFVSVILIFISIICLRFNTSSPETAMSPIVSQSNAAGALAANPSTANVTTTDTLSTGAATNNTSEKPRRQPSWGLVAAWIALSAVNWLLGIVLFGVILEAGSYINSREWETIVIFMIMNLLVTIPAVIIFLIWLYQSWDAIPSSNRSITPGKAVGFLFIPFFSLYWLFRVVPGLSAAIKRSRGSVGTQPIGSAGYGVGIAACVIAIIPYIGIFSWPFFLIWIILANKDKNLMLLEQQPAATQGQEIHVVAGTV